jgi:NAD(P)-dependent dehydrogenase (short-subunit alcohol dehydrogenase family)
VTGANRGLGLEIARQLAERGDRVILAARDLRKGEAAAAPLRDAGLDVSAIELDMSDPGSIAQASTSLARELDSLDVLVNNAAVLNDLNVMPSETDEAVLRENLEVNFIGPYLLTKALTPLLLEAEAACVLNMATQVGTFNNLADPDSPLLDDICPAYQASKIGLNATTVLFAKELRGSGVKVNSTCPGWVLTDMGHEDLPDYGDAARPQTPAEAVAALLWLTDLPADGPTGKFFTGAEQIPW